MESRETYVAPARTNAAVAAVHPFGSFHWIIKSHPIIVRAIDYFGYDTTNAQTLTDAIIDDTKRIRMQMSKKLSRNNRWISSDQVKVAQIVFLRKRCMAVMKIAILSFIWSGRHVTNNIDLQCSVYACVYYFYPFSVVVAFVVVVGVIFVAPAIDHHPNWNGRKRKRR